MIPNALLAVACTLVLVLAADTHTPWYWHLRTALQAGAVVEARQARLRVPTAAVLHYRCSAHKIVPTRYRAQTVVPATARNVYRRAGYLPGLVHLDVEAVLGGDGLHASIGAHLARLQQQRSGGEREHSRGAVVVHHLFSSIPVGVGIHSREGRRKTDTYG